MTSILNYSRNDRRLQEQIHDPYKARGKMAETSVCPVCSAVYTEGRWRWQESWPADAHQSLCQACRRIRDNYPAGLLVMSGDFIRTHREEVINVARHQERNERERHPLHRIIGIENKPATVQVTTTDMHLPKRIGQALHRAYKGRLEMHYDKDGCFVRANWSANDFLAKGKQSVHSPKKETPKKKRRKL